MTMSHNRGSEKSRGRTKDENGVNPDASGYIAPDLSGVASPMTPQPAFSEKSRAILAGTLMCHMTPDGVPHSDRRGSRRRF